MEEMEKELLKGHMEGTKMLLGHSLANPSALSRPAAAEHHQKHAAFKQYSEVAPWVWGYRGECGWVPAVLLHLQPTGWEGME